MNLAEVLSEARLATSEEDLAPLYKILNPAPTEKEMEENLQDALGYNPMTYYIEQMVKNISKNMKEAFEIEIDYNALKDTLISFAHDSRDVGIAIMAYSELVSSIDNTNPNEDLKLRTLINNSIPNLNDKEKSFIEEFNKYFSQGSILENAEDDEDLEEENDENELDNEEE